MFETMTDEELQAKYDSLNTEVSILNTQQMAYKIALNSAYGGLGSPYHRYYNLDMAEAVTITGQYVIRHLANRVNAFLNKTFQTQEDYIVASDTDSIYVRLARVADRYNHSDVQKTVTFLDQFCEQAIQPVIDKAFAEIGKYLNVYVPCLSMKREIIADKGIWTAKKRYILNVWDTEGVRHHEPKLKMMGIETVKSSTPSLVRDLITRALELVMRGTEEDLWTFVDQQYHAFSQAPFEDVAFPRSVNGIDKYSDVTKGLPIHVRGALVYNTHIESLTAYRPIVDGQKIRFAYLRLPNRLHSNVVSAPDGCPPEWSVESYLDYRMQWEKSFLEPLQAIVRCIGWHLEPQQTLF